MNLLSQIEKWSSTHHPKWLIFLRVILGLCLFAKGISFLGNDVLLRQIMEGSGLGTSPWLAQFIAWAHLLGGFLIIVGLFTRMACLIQIPILLGAVLFVHSRSIVISSSTESLLSIIVLFLLVVFFIEGGGWISLDRHFNFNNAKDK
ncbi:DoxX family protein [Ferruginibacter sp. SUN002]|uniref:DoxX family protein n=1 Tax=Ferruginibacter sp. SUN002 TaxID=2937789 RepID=UPI003D36118F